MKFYHELTCKVLVCLMLCFWMDTANAKVNPKPFVIPELTCWTGAEGEFAPSGRIAIKGGNKELMHVAEAFAEDYLSITGKKLTIVNGRGKAGDFSFEIKKNKSLGDEGYKLDITNKATVSATTAQGVFWGTRTLLQLTEQHKSRNLPKGLAIDIPEYKMRGFMLDCGRKYIPMDYLNKLVKIMAYYKMNTLQVHLNDNGFKQYFNNDWDKTPAAFRLECDTYPGLTAKDGSYTKKEFIDMQIAAEKNYVEIIPEIDVPAHTLAFTHYKPEIGSEEYGMDHLDLFNPETYKFVDGLFKEYLEGENPVFRGKRVHIGTDEYSNRDQKVVEKFREFTDHYIRFVESFGKQAVCWGALTHANGKTQVKSENVIMSCWYNGYANPKTMKDQGYQLISIPDGQVYIVPSAGYYYDYLNCEYLYNKWTPSVIGNQTFEKNDPAILGGMFAVWNDHHGNGITVKDIHHRLFPALQTLSVKCWTGHETSLPYEEFDKLRLHLSEAPAVNELGTYGTENKEVYSSASVTPGMKCPFKEIGYDYSVSFTIDVKAEEKGTELFRSPNAVFYLSDPAKGRLGFARDGYLNQFKYTLPVGKKVTITVQGNNKKTELYVDGKQVQVLDVITLYALKERDRFDFQLDENMVLPEVYVRSDKMYYNRTLVFPLDKAGNFKSTVSNLKVYNYLKEK